MNTVPNEPRIVVCLCTTGRDTARACVAHLLRQTVGVSLVIVDNSAAGEAWRNLFDGDAPAHVRIVHEPRAGIPFARNAALDEAKRLAATHIAFIDDDEIAPRTWVETLHSVMLAHGADVVQGPLLRAATVDDCIAMAAAYEPRPGKVRRRRTAATNNVLFKAGVVDHPGVRHFDTALAMLGGSDTEFFMRVADSGARIVRANTPPVFEAWDGERVDARYLRLRAWRVGASTNYRYRKNRNPAVAGAVLTSRALSSLTSGCLQCARAMFYRRAELTTKGTASLYFGFGCLSPYFGVQPTKYY